MAHLVFDMGGGPIHLVELRQRLDDGYFHRIRILRNATSILFEVDELRTLKNSSSELT